MRTVVIFESLTGTTRRAAELIGNELRKAGVEATVCPIERVQLGALARADLVVVGSWVDGLIFVGQRPGGASRLRNLPVVDGMTAAVFCTYAVDPGKTLSKLTDIVADRGGNVIGGVALHRKNLVEGVRDFVDQLLATVSSAG